MTNALILVAHAPLAHALRQSARHVLGAAAADIGTVDVDAGLSMSQVVARVREAVACCAAHEGVLVLTDILGATPCNAAVQTSRGDCRVRVLAGVNLPMLLRALTYRDRPLAQMAQYALSGGTRGVLQVDPESHRGGE